MPDAIYHGRRSFLGVVAAGKAAAGTTFMGAGRVGSGEAAGSGIGLAPVRQIGAGVLDVGCYEAGPSVGAPVRIVSTWCSIPTATASDLPQATHRMRTLKRSSLPNRPSRCPRLRWTETRMGSCRQRMGRRRQPSSRGRASIGRFRMSAIICRKRPPESSRMPCGSRPPRNADPDTRR